MLLPPPGVTERCAGSFRPPGVCVGVFALETGVLALLGGGAACGVLPLTCGFLMVEGELERVDGELDEPAGLLIFLIEIGSFEAPGEPLRLEEAVGVGSWFD